MRIEFNKDEKIEFLRKIGFIHELYIGERDRNMYSSDDEKISVKCDIAYHPSNKPENLETMDFYHLTENFGLDSVFKRELSWRFKSFVMEELIKI